MANAASTSWGVPLRQLGTQLEGIHYHCLLVQPQLPRSFSKLRELQAILIKLPLEEAKCCFTLGLHAYLSLVCVFVTEYLRLGNL